MPRVPRGPVRAADLVARSVMFPEPGRVSELVAALRPAVAPSAPRPDDGDAPAAAADHSAEERHESAARKQESAREADHQQEQKAEDTVAESTPAAESQQEAEVEDAVPAAEEPEDASQSAAAATSSSLADSIVSQSSCPLSLNASPCSTCVLACVRGHSAHPCCKSDEASAAIAHPVTLMARLILCQDTAEKPVAQRSGSRTLIDISGMFRCDFQPAAMLF